MFKFLCVISVVLWFVAHNVSAFNEGGIFDGNDSIYVLILLSYTARNA